MSAIASCQDSELDEVSEARFKEACVAEQHGETVEERDDVCAGEVVDAPTLKLRMFHGCWGPRLCEVVETGRMAGQGCAMLVSVPGETPLVASSSKRGVRQEMRCSGRLGDWTFVRTFVRFLETGEGGRPVALRRRLQGQGSRHKVGRFFSQDQNTVPRRQMRMLRCR